MGDMIMGVNSKKKVVVRKKKKRKFAKKVYSLKNYEYNYCGSLEFEDALDYIRRKEILKIDFSFKKDENLIIKKNKITSNQPNKKRKNSGNSDPILHKSMDDGDLMRVARQRRNRRFRERVKRVKVIYSENKPPVNVFQSKYPKELISRFFKVGVSEMKGKKPYMEDRNCILLKKKYNYIGVFDGHIGYKASDYVSKRLIKIISSKISNKNIKYLAMTPDVKKIVSNKKAYKELKQLCIRDSFLQVHDELLKERIYEGTCASIIYFANKLRPHYARMFCANVGDSTAVLYYNDGKYMELTEDHDPGNPKEVERIANLGGSIQNGRINGLLNVTRALGDEFSDLISRDPFVMSLKVKTNFDKIIVASDGLWKYVGREKANEICLKEKDPRYMAQKLRNFAFEQGSTDNITVIVIKFDFEGETEKMFVQENIKENINEKLKFFQEKKEGSTD